MSNRGRDRPRNPNGIGDWNLSPNQKQIVVPKWQLKSFTWEMVVWGNINFFLVVWGSRIVHGDVQTFLAKHWPCSAAEALF